MTTPPPPPYTLRLDADGCGTLLGALAWVLGALEIMKDRGHADEDERWHELSDALTPRLESLVAALAAMRAAAGDDPAREADVEAAYAGVRQAFESWIQITATDTIVTAIEQRLAAAGDLPGEPASDPSNGA